MHLRKLLLLMLCSLSPFLSVVSDGQSVVKPRGTGVIRGSVWTGAEDVSGKWSVIVSGGPGFRSEFVTDDRGQFEKKVPPGIYVAYLKSDTKTDSRLQIPFRVSRGSEVRIELDSTEGLSRCSPKGERVIPLEARSEQYQPPQIEPLTIFTENKEALKLVVQHCGMQKLDDRTIFTSAMLKTETGAVYAERVVLWKNNKLETPGRTVVVYEGVREELRAGFKTNLNDGTFAREARSRNPK